MYLSRILLSKKPAFKPFAIPGKTAKQIETYENFKKVTGHNVLNQIKSDFNNQSFDHQSYWEKLRCSNSDLIKLKINNTNFENKFLDLIYEFGLKDQRVLTSLKDYFRVKKIDKNRIQKSAYGQILLMLKSLKPDQLSDENDEIIDKIYLELKNDNLLNVQVCDNFLIEFIKSSPERFEQVCKDYFENKVNLNGIEKRTQFMELLFDNKKYTQFFKLLSTYVNHPDQALNLFRSKSNQIEDEQFYIEFLKSINNIQIHLETKDIDQIVIDLDRFGYKPVLIQPKTTNCPNCNELMPKMKMNEIEELKKYFLKQFLRASKGWPNPKSRILVEKYIDFLENRYDFFDLVIDGLNLGFQGKIEFKMINNEPGKGGIHLKTTTKLLEDNSIKLLDNIVKSQLYKNILFIGRFFQANSTKLTEFFIKHNISFRFFEKQVEDDISVILAALYSPNSRILTNDYYEDHLNKIEDLNLRRLFFEFLYSRQVTVMRRNYTLNYQNEGWIKKVHHNSKTNTLHIPFDNESIVYRHLFIWQCFRKIN